MFKFKRKNKKGFTLTELLVVVLVISVLTAISIPSYKRAVERTRAMQGVVTLQNIAKAQNVYNAKRGSYATNMHALPLDMKDLRGEDVVGDTFEDRFFGYTVYGDILSQSYAKRSDGGYELAIDYDTGKLYCTPADNETCKMLGFDVNTKEIPTTDTESKLACNDEVCYLYDGDKIIGKCEFRAGYLDTCQSTDTNGFMCIEDECGEFRNGALLDGTHCKKEDLNKEGTACAKYTFECDKEKGFCYTYKDGEEIKSCPIDETGTKCKPEVLTGWVCDKAEDFCRFYDENGNDINKCIANAEHTACLKDGEKICKEDGTCILSDAGICIANKDGSDCETGLICAYDGGWVCREFDNGKEVKTCFANEDRTGCLEEGKLVCRDGKCVDSQGNWCESNKEGTACKTATENVGSYYECDGDTCVVYDKDGKEIKSCYMDNVDCFKEFAIEGTLCNKDGACLTYGKDGSLSSKCWKTEDGSAYCDDYVNNKYNCESNSSMSGCKEETSNTSGKWSCDGSKCSLYDEDGKEIKTCELGNDSCFKDNNIDATLCDDSSCITYKPGENPLKCVKDIGMCYDGSGFECKSNATFSGCAEESGSSSSGGKTFKCDDTGFCTFYDEDGKEIGKCQGSLTGGYADSCVSEFGGSGFYCTVYTDGNKICKVYENGKETIKCDGANGTCDTPNGPCKANETLTGCADDSGVVYSGTWQCGGNTCKLVDEKGNVIQVCDMNKDPSCFENNKVDGVVCVEDGTCYTYENGKNVLKCQNGKCYDEKGNECVANYNGTACRPEGNTSNRPCEVSCKNGTCSCWDENGALYFNCPYGDNECFKNVGFSGTYCDEDGNCSTYENGEQLYQCANSGICVNNITGKECTSNETFSGCKEGSTSTEPDNPKNGTVCYKEEDGKKCYTYKDGKLVDSCNANKTMDGCAPTDQDEELICYKDLGVCYDFTTDGKIIGQCPINTAGTDCASSETDKMTNGLLCDKDKCYTYKDGKVVGTCEANNTSTGCKDETGSTSGDLKCSSDTCVYFDADGNKKECYSNGKGGCIDGKGEEFACYKDKGRCRTYKDGKPMDECDINESGTGCKEEGSSSGVYTCNGWECKDADGSVCYSNGKDGCIEGKGEEVICMDGKCMTYKDGKKTDWCEANDEGTGCKEDNNVPSGNLMCAGETCTDPDGNTCFNNGNNGCITGKGWEMGACNDTECYVYQDGKQHKCYRDQWTVGGCNNNTMFCYGAECVYYQYGIPTGKTCYSNNNGGCIEGKGEEFICIADQCNLYQDGELVDSCVANTTFTGCRKEGELSGCKHSIIETSGGFYVEYSEGKPTGVTYMRSEDGKCMGYYNGKPNGEAPDPNYCSGSSSCLRR